MALLNLIPYNTKINFVGRRYISFAVSAFIVVATLISLVTNGLHYGIDFKGGLVIEVRLPESPDIPTLRTELNALNFGEMTIQSFGESNDILVRVEQPENEEAVIKSIKNVLGEKADYRRIDKIGPKVGEELIQNGLKALGIAFLAMLAYIAFRFEWQFAVCAIVALLHDCFAVLALFTIFPLEFNENAIVAILLTAGYSINDTIVIFDRIRENLARMKAMPLGETINMSINETLSRTILTVTTTLLALIALYIWGGTIISSFSLPIIIGVVIGSFSSICLASPLLLHLNLRAKDPKIANQK
jgi:preprotein translocase subunit SecF